MTTRIGVVSVSDRASSGVYEDKGAPAIHQFLSGCITSPIEYVTCLIPDDLSTITATLIDLVDVQKCSLVVTTGGTGPSPRDVTPEAVQAVCSKILPGFGEAMRAVSLGLIPTAILSRQIAGIRGASLLIALPGKPTAIAECLTAVIAAVPDCLSVMGAPSLELVSSIGTYRPH
jgi:molybdopterin adenylyltransferase